MGRTVVASGGLVWRERAGAPNDGIEVLVIHRPSYDDWTFPKGKANRGERLPAAAYREVLEETALRIRLGAPLPSTEYAVNSGLKVVRYWSSRVVGDGPRPFKANREVDEVRWARPSVAAKLLSYRHDRDLLANFRELKKHGDHKTQTFVILRHAKAYTRGRWHGAESARPLTVDGATVANRLARTIDAYAVRKIVTSPAARCVATIQPFADRADVVPQLDKRLEESAKAKDVRAAITPLLQKRKPVVVCSHRPTLPAIFEAVGLDPVELEPGEAFIVHHHNGAVVATELIK
jgi:8-oxo-dGTP diphosphatase